MLADGLLCALIGLVALVPLAAAPKDSKGDPKDARTQLYALFDEEWEFELSENPLAATAVGEHRWDDKLPSVRVADEARRRFRDRLLAIDPAAAHKMGELKIRELRRRAEEALGTRFDLREFHDRVLSGGTVTLPILEARIDAYIRARKAAG